MNKNILQIEYNALNLPCEVTFGNGSTVTYLYSAGGTKLRTVHKTGNTTATTDYVGNVVYENNSPKLLLTDAGYVSLSDGKYHYYLKDHQGNNQVVINQSGTVEEVNHYYPFGGVFASSGNVQPYKYNGKELDRKNGLEWYDYGARHYDAALGRFMAVDSLATKHFSISPYVYCINNPVRFIDIDGNDWTEALVHLQKSFSGSISFGGIAGFSFNIMNIRGGIQVNAFSIRMGEDNALKYTTGVTLNTPIAGIELFDNAYDLNAQYAVKEEGFKVNTFFLASEEHKTTTYYDSTGYYYEEIDQREEVTTKLEAGVGAGFIVGAEVKIDLREFYKFIVELFKSSKNESDK